MIPSFKMGCYHQKDCIRPCQVDEKIKKPMGFEYTSLISTRTYSILSYIVGGFVGSKSQMNNEKHLSYDLSAAIFNLLNPQQKTKRPTEKIYCSKLNYDKYYQKSTYKEQAIDMELDLIGALSLFDQSMFNLNNYCDKVNKSQRSASDSETNVDRAPQESVHKDFVLERFRQQSESSVETTDSENFIIFDEEHNVKKEEKINVQFEIDDDDDDDDEEEEEEEEEEDDDDGDGGDDNDDDNDDYYYYYEEDEGDEGDCCFDENTVYSLDRELAEANEKWSKTYHNVSQNDGTPKKVRFDGDVKINRIVAWDYAYRAARTGPWEQMARDRVRFRERTFRLSNIISPVLERDHREKVYKKFYS